MSQEFLTGFYTFKHVGCEGGLKPERVGINDYDQVVVLGTCQKCGEADVATLISLKELYGLSHELRSKRVIPITAGTFSLKDRASLHGMGIRLPSDSEGGDLAS